MTDTDTIPVSASIASTGKGIRYIGDYAYAYSGVITSAGAGSADTTYLLFTTGSGLIVGQIRISNADSGNGERFGQILLNDIVVIDLKSDTAPDWSSSVYPLDIIIPPFTKL